MNAPRGVADLVIEADHPVFPGHFPGHPVVPGALLLELARDLIETRQGLTLGGLAVAKFFSPARPGEPLTLSWDCGEERVQFEIHGPQRRIAAGQFILAGRP